jgi:hypothetical protein
MLNQEKSCNPGEKTRKLFKKLFADFLLCGIIPRLAKSKNVRSILDFLKSKKTFRVKE